MSSVKDDDYEVLLSIATSNFLHGNKSYFSKLCRSTTVYTEILETSQLCSNISLYIDMHNLENLKSYKQINKYTIKS